MGFPWILHVRASQAPAVIPGAYQHGEGASRAGTTALGLRVVSFSTGALGRKGPAGPDFSAGLGIRPGERNKDRR